jgi:class 3 adenylate cyclase
LTFAAWVADALAVLDRVGSTRAVLLGASSSSLVAVLFAAEHPERTASLVVINGTPRIMQAEGYDIGVPVEILEEFRAGLDPDRPGEGNEELSDLRLFAPSSADDPEFQQWWSRASKRGTAPATAVLLGRATTDADVRHLLGGIDTPALVLHRREALGMSFEQGAYLAQNIPGARFVELPGNDVVPFTGNLDELVDEIQEFITGERYQPGPNRTFATILFTDIVDSTITAARLGDRRWSQVLRDLDLLHRRQLERFGGTFVKDTGDGLLATFDGPSSTVRCALAIRDGADHLGVQIRAGVHAGEVERRGLDVGGIAVHVAARVLGAAQAGEVLVSDILVALVEGAGIAFTDRGIHTLKGIEKDRHLWAVASA